MPLAAVIANLLNTTQAVTPSATNSLTIDANAAGTVGVDGRQADTKTISLN